MPSDDIVHATAKRSWWDGSITARCGRKFRPGYYRECWFNGGVTCPGCKTAQRQGPR